jgi:hypothetical protein
MPIARRVGRYCGLFLRIAVTFIVLVPCHAQNVSHQNVVARIGDRHTITFAELEQYVHDYDYTYRYRRYPPEPFEKALDDMIVEQLKRADFFALGLNNDTESLPPVWRSIVEEMVIRYFTTSSLKNTLHPTRFLF